MSGEAADAVEKIIALASDKRKRKSGSEKREAAEPPRPLMRELPPPDPFPTDALDGMLANAAVGIQDKTQGKERRTASAWVASNSRSASARMIAFAVCAWSGGNAGYSGGNTRVGSERCTIAARWNS